MKASDVHIGSCYRAQVSGRLVIVRVESVHHEYSGANRTRYQVTNLKTGRRLVFRSAQRLRPLPTAAELGIDTTLDGWLERYDRVLGIRP